jgi:hypothetical protein
MDDPKEDKNDRDGAGRRKEQGGFREKGPRGGERTKTGPGLAQ